MDLLILSQVANLCILAILFVGLPWLITRTAFSFARRVLPSQWASRLQWPVAALFWLLLALWGFAGYQTFTDTCRTLPAPSFFQQAAVKPDGFLIDQAGVRSLSDQQTLRVADLVNKGQFQFYEENYGTPEQPLFMRSYLDRKESGALAQSDYVIEMPRPQQLARWWQPPVYLSEILVRERKTGVLLARASEVIFGGGLTGLYLRALGGDQDNAFLACGYLSPDIGEWRPTLSSNPRFAEYAATDSQLLLKTLIPKVER